MEQRTKVLDVSGLTIGLKSGAGTLLLSDISFELYSDQVVGVIGESGSGKTILSRALVNWIYDPLEITSGTIDFLGADLLKAPADEMQKLRGRDIAYIGSDPGSALDPTLPVGRQLVEKLRAVEPGVSETDALNRVLQVLDAVRMPSHRQRVNDFPFQFSGGMMQRVMIVDALITNPKFVVCDNITQPLDVTVAAQILRLLKGLQHDFATSIVFVSSAMGIVGEFADRVLVLADGRIVEEQRFDDLLASPRHSYTRQLIDGLPKIWQSDGTPTSSERGGDDRPVVLSVRNVSKTYETRERGSFFSKREVQAVRGVSFDTYRGENLGIIGESGCGKSTLSRLLSRVEEVDAGQIMFEGRDISHMSRKELLSLRKRFQLILQDPFNAIPPHFTLGRTIAEPLLIQGGISRRQVRDKVRAVMEEVGLSGGLYDSLPVSLSAGQRQRVNIARAMVLDPELLILDETLSTLDQVEQAKLLELFERLQQARSMTYIYISHDLSMVRQVCDRIAVMYLGRIVEIASNRSTFFDPAHPYTRALLSAVPTIERRPYEIDTYLLEGEPPDPVDIPPGCSFRTRCPFAFQPCSSDDPMLVRRSDFSSSACHLAEKRWATAGHAMPTPTFDAEPASAA